jgi:hypothetical protein
MIAHAKLMGKKIISKDSLNRMFDQYNNPASVIYEDKCYDCGCCLKVEIKKTSGGYGLLGGYLYETELRNYIGLCVGCYEKKWQRKKSC